MAARVVLFGATGYTGSLTARALVARGVKPVLAGRSPARLDALLDEFGGGLEVAVADVSDAESVAGLVAPGDVLLSTVGPFARLGAAAAEAAIARGAHYLDSNGEPAFTRMVFERYGPAARAAGLGLLTAFGWECVLGNLAGALALEEAGDGALRVDTGYFYVGGAVPFSGGTRASFADAMAMPSFAYRDGAIRTVRGGERYRTMSVSGVARPGVSFGGSEHFALPRSFRQLREVNAYQGWFGGLSPRVARVLHASSRTGSAVLGLPGARALYRRVVGLRRPGGGPSSAERAAASVHVVAMAYGPAGAPLAEVHLSGPEGYELTASILAWGAERAASGAQACAGALGPVEAFGIEELEAGCREAGVKPG